MREFKFRAWRKEHKQMDYSKSWQDLWEFHEYHDKVFGKDGYLLMQYTGLKDKNGKEIYEGDIVRGRSYGFPTTRNYIGVVEYWYNGFSVKENKDKGIRDGLNTTFEVIGNIYENPELLES